MAQKAPISYKPTMDPDELKDIIVRRLRYVAVNRFIDEAVREKLERVMGASQEARMSRLVSAVEEAVREYRGWTTHKPSKAKKREIDRLARPIEEGLVKPVKWSGSFVKRPRG
jgi:hypothetical protein